MLSLLLPPTGALASTMSRLKTLLILQSVPAPCDNDHPRTLPCDACDAVWPSPSSSSCPISSTCPPTPPHSNSPSTLHLAIPSPHRHLLNLVPVPDSDRHSPPQSTISTMPACLLGATPSARIIARRTSLQAAYKTLPPSPHLSCSRSSPLSRHQPHHHACPAMFDDMALCRLRGPDRSHGLQRLAAEDEGGALQA